MRKLSCRPSPLRGNSFHLFFSLLFTCFFSHFSGYWSSSSNIHYFIFLEKNNLSFSCSPLLRTHAIRDINLPPRVSFVLLFYHYFCNAHFAMETYFWKRHICTICSWPPFCHLDSSRRSLRWCSLVRHPINSGERIEVVSISPRLHCAYCKILCIDSFGPGCDSMVHCDGVIQVHVIKGDLYLNLFVRIEAVWWEYHCLATWIWPIGNSKKLDTTMNDWKACRELKSWSFVPSVTIFSVISQVAEGFHVYPWKL